MSGLIVDPITGDDKLNKPLIKIAFDIILESWLLNLTQSHKTSLPTYMLLFGHISSQYRISNKIKLRRGQTKIKYTNL